MKYDNTLLLKCPTDMLAEISNDEGEDRYCCCTVGYALRGEA